MKAATSDEASSSILHSSLRFMSLSAVDSLPKIESLMRSVRRQRSAPHSDSNTLSPDILRETDRGEEFILYEYNEMIIFTAKTNLSLLKDCKHCVPEQFYQLFTLHTLLKSVIIPFVYSLLIGKKASDYKNFFEKVLEKDNFALESILSDFESATTKTIKEIFPNVEHRGNLNIEPMYSNHNYIL
ncbi:unnamed protein product [Rotaria sp. Silwood1]|nr:unnamed protein product [Rotaria sp. Silwood1]CAF1570798.1 unnamed protein product [Rotaria sp. Silwood1]CAF3712031.1 unnamed protein product [Rotaria sp. Silwood1]